MKAYNKVFIRVIEEGKYIVKYPGELMNSKLEWHQPQIIRTIMYQGGAEMVSVGQSVAGGMVAAFQRAGGCVRVRGASEDGRVEEEAVQGVKRAPEAGVASRTRSSRPIGEAAY